MNITSPDWRLTGPVIEQSLGRVLQAGSISDPGSFDLTQDWRIFEEVIPLSLTSPHPVSSVDFTYVSTTSPDDTFYHKTAIFGISTSPAPGGPFTAAALAPSSFNADVVAEAPEPCSLGLVLLTSAGLLRRKRA